MPTLKQLQRENERLKKMQTKLNEIQKNNEDRRSLLKQNKKLSRNLKHGKAIRAARVTGKILSEVGKSGGRGLARIGTGAFRGLQRYGNFLAEQEKKQRRTNKQLRSAKKTIRKVSKRKSRRRR